MLEKIAQVQQAMEIKWPWLKEENPEARFNMAIRLVMVPANLERMLTGIDDAMGDLQKKYDWFAKLPAMRRLHDGFRTWRALDYLERVKAQAQG